MPPTRGLVEAWWRAVLAEMVTREAGHQWAEPLMLADYDGSPAPDLLAMSGLQYLHGFDNGQLRMLAIANTSEPRGALRVTESTHRFPTSEVRWTTLGSVSGRLCMRGTDGMRRVPPGRNLVVGKNPDGIQTHW